MKLEERLSAHFQSTSDGLRGAETEIGTIITASKSRTNLTKILLGGSVVLLGLAVLGLGLTFATPQRLALPWSTEYESESDDTRVVVSPFLNVESRLTSQADEELFTVRTNTPAYWRIATLETYEDQIWKTVGDFEQWRPPETGPGSDRTEIRQEFEIKSLAAIWLPAAAEPIDVFSPDARITSDPVSNSLTVSNQTENSDGLSYTVVSSPLVASTQQLRDAPPPDLDVLGREYVSTANVPESVGLRAREITSGRQTDYDKVLALQNHFREYGYSVDFRPRANDPVVHFLEEREGFSQQFAGTFALMARELGIPTRVAIGFTWGDPLGREEAESGDELLITYSVTGRHTHAWPEVYFEGIGWVGFEPTPGRGMPGAVNYTGVAAQQDSNLQPNPEAGN